jgi:hypothetical protein
VTRSNESHGLVLGLFDKSRTFDGEDAAFLCVQQERVIMAPVRTIGYVARRTVQRSLLLLHGSYSLFFLFFHVAVHAVLGATTTLNSLFIDWGRSHGSEFFRD